MKSIVVVDNALKDWEALRQVALNADYTDWQGPDGAVYKRICIVHVPEVEALIEDVYGPSNILGMAFRLNYNGELPNQLVHSDVGWGTHAGVIYLSEGPGGTAFWRHIATGATKIEQWEVELAGRLVPDMDDPSKWNMDALVELKPNRAVFYESTYIHSRWPLEAFGTSPETGRLILVVFFTPLRGPQ